MFKRIYKSYLLVFWLNILLLLIDLTVSKSQNTFFESVRSFNDNNDFQRLFHSPSRTLVDLNGYWEYKTGNHNWKKIYIPSVYNFEGTVIFQREFEFPKNSGYRNLSLVCYGINYQCEVFINNEFVGHHVGGYSSFIIKIPDRIVNPDGINTIRIQVDNDLNSRESIPLQQQIGGWKNYGGIFRDIYIVSSPGVYFDDVNIITSLQSNYSTASVSVNYQINSTDLKKLKYDSIDIIENSKNSFDVYFQLFDPVNNALLTQSSVTTIELDDNRSIRLNLVASFNNPILWEPNNPKLYLVKSIISRNGMIVDEISYKIGIRDLKINNKSFYLNGRTFELKGINYVEDFPNYGSAIDYESIEKDIRNLKNLGVNIINVKYYPPSPFLVSLCDKYGIFICENIPIWNTPAVFLQDAKYLNVIENYTREMIYRDKNHPSVFAWGIGLNFDTSDPIAINYCNHINNFIKNLDNRFTFYTTNFIINDTCVGITDFNVANIDVSDLKKFSNLLIQWVRKNDNLPVVINITGAVIIPENHNGFGDPLSVEYQAHYIFDRFRILQQNNISNMILGSYSDYIGDKPIMIVNNYDRYLYTVGVFNYYREPRITASMLKALYNDEKTPNLIVGDYNQSHPIIFILWGLLLLIIFAYVFNTYRRFRENIVRSFLRPFNFFADIRDQRIISNIQTAIVGIIIAGTFALIFSNIFYFYRFNYFVDYLLTHLIPNNDIKYWFCNQIWNPTKFIISFTLLNLLFIILISLIIKLGSIIAKRRIFISDSFAIVIWSALPAIILIPFGMILSRIFENETYLYPMMIFIVFEVLWVFYRLLKGVSIVYDIKISKVYFFTFILLFIIVGSYFIYINHENSTIYYISYMINMFKGLQI